MLPDQNRKNNANEQPIPENLPNKAVDPDEVVHELPDLEPEIPADPDDLVHTFPPQQEIINTDDVDDLIHPPAIDGDDIE